MYCMHMRNAQIELRKKRSIQDKRDTASEESKAKERESDRLTKKRCTQGEFSRDR